MIAPKYWDPHPEHVKLVLDSIGKQDTVLDIGGWWKPLTRANYVVDCLPYESRGGGGQIGPLPELFTAETWITMDICDEPLPFSNKSIDFVYCGQTLEDLRDPLRICREMIRVGKRGYIEVPSIWIECQNGIDASELSALYPGYEKHRWLVQINEGKLTFIPKLVWLGLYSFVPKATVDLYISDQKLWTDCLLWRDSFQYEELLFSGQDDIVPVLENYFATLDYSRYKSSMPNMYP